MIYKYNGATVAPLKGKKPVLIRYTIPPITGQCGDDVYWSLKDGLLTISGSGDMWGWSNTTYPSFYKYNVSIRKVVIEEGITNIGAYAFRGLSRVTQVELPDGMTEIGSHAFFGVTSLNTINIPSSVRTMNNYSFYGCTNVSTVNITDLDAWATMSCGTLGSPLQNNAILYVNGERPTEYTFADGTTSIPNFCFWNQSTMATINLPDTVTRIGSYAFGKTSITDINTPNVKTIGVNAFQNCYSLTDIALPSVTSIDNYALYMTVSCAVYDFSGCTTVPVLGTDAITFSTTISHYIYVPAALYDEWIASTNWAALADYIVAK